MYLSCIYESDSAGAACSGVTWSGLHERSMRGGQKWSKLMWYSAAMFFPAILKINLFLWWPLARSLPYRSYWITEDGF